MAQCIRVLATKPDDLSLILSIYIIQAKPTPAACPLAACLLWHASPYAAHIDK